MQLEDFSDNLRINPELRDPLLDRLDLAAAKASAVSRRSSQRMEYRADDVPVSVSHPGGSVSHCLVKSRNLSAGGMSFLHGGFLHHNTECRIVLKTVDGKPVIVEANVRSCRLIHRHIHEVGVQFQQKLDPSLFCRNGASVTSHEGQSTPSSCFGSPISILLATDATTDCRAIVTRLRARGAAVLIAHSTGAASDLLRRLKFDCVVVRRDEAGGLDSDLVAAIRDLGHAGPVVTIEQPDTFDAVMEKQLRGIRGAATQTIVCDAMIDDSLIQHYLEAARTLSRQLREAIEAKDGDAARRACLQIRTTAGGYGFGVVAEVARQAEQVLKASPAGSAEAFSTVEFLATILLRLRMPSAHRAA